MNSADVLKARGIIHEAKERLDDGGGFTSRFLSLGALKLLGVGEVDDRLDADEVLELAATMYVRIDHNMGITS